MRGCDSCRAGPLVPRPAARYSLVMRRSRTLRRLALPLLAAPWSRPSRPGSRSAALHRHHRADRRRRHRQRAERQLQPGSAWPRPRRSARSPWSPGRRATSAGCNGAAQLRLLRRPCQHPHRGPPLDDPALPDVLAAMPAGSNAAVDRHGRPRAAVPPAPRDAGRPGQPRPTAPSWASRPATRQSRPTCWPARPTCWPPARRAATPWPRSAPRTRWRRRPTRCWTSPTTWTPARASISAPSRWTA